MGYACEGLQMDVSIFAFHSIFVFFISLIIFSFPGLIILFYLDGMPRKGYNVYFLAAPAFGLVFLAPLLLVLSALFGFHANFLFFIALILFFGLLFISNNTTVFL